MEYITVNDWSITVNEYITNIITLRILTFLISFLTLIV